MRYKLAIFDLDGTILDTIEDLTDSLNLVLRRHDCPERSLAEVKKFLGSGIRSLLTRAAPSGCNKAAVDRLYADFIEHYRENCARKTRPFAGIAELLAELRGQGLQTAVISNKADAMAQTLCAKHFAGLFDYVAGEKAGVPRKPAPDAVNAALAALNRTSEQAVYIGDSEVDIETARRAHMDGIAVGWGYREAAFLRECGAEAFVGTPAELRSLLAARI